MPQDQARYFLAIVEKIGLTKAETTMRHAQVLTEIERAKDQLATSRQLLAQADALLRRS